MKLENRAWNKSGALKSSGYFSKIPSLASFWKARGGNFGDFIFSNITRLFAFILLLLVLVMGYQMLVQALPSIEKFGWKFITSGTWDPVHEEFGAMPFIF